MSPATELLRLADGEARIDIAPAAGGAIAAYAWRGEDILRPASAAAIAAGDPLGMGCFPMVPFAGRIAGGQFEVGGRAVALPANLAGEASAIHGQGWRLPWTVAGHDGRSARLSLFHPAGHWPWDYEAGQTIALEAGALRHELSVTNRSPETMPAGLGLHPYLPRGPDTRLTARVEGVFLDPAAPPAPLPAAWDWRSGRELTAFADHQFAGWSGEARIDWPSRGLAVRLAAEPPRPWLVVFAPVGEPYACVEPVTHQLDAVNRSEGGASHGMVMLAPGETLSMTMRLTPLAAD